MICNNDDADHGEAHTHDSMEHDSKNIKYTKRYDYKLEASWQNTTFQHYWCSCKGRLSKR